MCECDNVLSVLVWRIKGWLHGRHPSGHDGMCECDNVLMC